jgi:uncharacterized protein YaiI (UPF0178 family)
VKQDIYRLAKPYKLGVTLVSGSWMRIPEGVDATLRVVGQGMDAADDWIAEKVEADDIVVTADVPLAARCVEKGAYVPGPAGKPFTEDNIGPALASQNLLSDLRELGGRLQADLHHSASGTAPACSKGSIKPSTRFVASKHEPAQLELKNIHDSFEAALLGDVRCIQGGSL